MANPEAHARLLIRLGELSSTLELPGAKSNIAFRAGVDGKFMKEGLLQSMKHGAQDGTKNAMSFVFDVVLHEGITASDVREHTGTPVDAHAGSQLPLTIPPASQLHLSEPSVFGNSTMQEWAEKCCRLGGQGNLQQGYQLAVKAGFPELVRGSTAPQQRSKFAEWHGS